ncbi:hypothetical protein Pcinc_030999 [Petrolisthes cinctipes]|uniref:Uncharacterized protein n=1 Tax=Petrolisthes cinctipes TaxID=88211 RepID=A0AAE1EXL6_PETCI|nr:hypothetical protein Pcinc_030999 [Petrolisthes cinctipes]
MEAISQFLPDANEEARYLYYVVPVQRANSDAFTSAVKALVARVQQKDVTIDLDYDVDNDPTGESDTIQVNIDMDSAEFTGDDMPSQLDTWIPCLNY